MVLPILVAGIDKCCHESFDEEKPKINYKPSFMLGFFIGVEIFVVFLRAGMSFGFLEF